MFEYDSRTRAVGITGYAEPINNNDKFSERGVMNAYMEQAVLYSALPDEERHDVLKYMDTRDENDGKTTFLQEYIPRADMDVYLQEMREAQPDATGEKGDFAQYLGKKYKPVALKVKPMYSDLPEKFRIKRDIRGDPLADMPELKPISPEFTPTGRYTQERMEQFTGLHQDFLLEEELKLLHQLMMNQESAFAWDASEGGKFRTDFFPPVDMPIIEHKPWVLKNIPIPPGLYKQICEIIREKIEAGIYEPSNSSYRSRWFTVAKKTPGQLRIVHSLEPLNAVTIAHSGIPPATDELASHFAGRACGGMFDLFVGYDERLLAESSRDLTTFQTPFGAMRLVTLPMGWTNSVPIFHDDVTKILSDEIPEFTIPYIDDVPVRGPASRYIQGDGSFEMIPENPGIRRFVMQHMINVNRIVQHIKYCGATFSGHKSILCAEEIMVVGHMCSYEGRVPTTERIKVIMDWAPCIDQSQLRAFMGTVGVLRIFIPNFSRRAKDLTKLLRMKIPWEWGVDQDEGMRALKEGCLVVKALKPIDYENEGDVVLAVDTSYIAVGYYIYQERTDNPKEKIYARFGSIPLNKREANFSQPKRELFGLMRALEACKHWLIGVRKLVVETDASYIKGMLENPDMMPNATINRWIDNIKLFHFTLKHKNGATFGPDGLSRRLPQPEDEVYPNPFEENEDPGGPPEVVIADPTEPQPIPIEEFRDNIDPRGGYFQGIATNVHDFEYDLARALAVDEKDRKLLMDFLKSKSNKMSKEDTEMVEQLVNQALAPGLEERDCEEKREHYDQVHRTKVALDSDRAIPTLIKWLKDPTKDPDHCRTPAEIKKFKRWASKFFLDKRGRLYRRGAGSMHKLVVEKEHRMYMLKSAHDSLGHRGIYSTAELLKQRFWWPDIERDVVWYIKTCHLCQERQRTLLEVPPIETHTPSIFQTIHVDTIHMAPASNGHKYIVHGRDHLSSWAEARALKNENAESIGRWIFEEIVCRWGCLVEIVTDNGGPFRKAVRWLEQKYGITGITISSYNSRANGSVERPHWDIRQMLYKACGGDISKWWWFLPHVLWADRISIRKRLGCSPFFMVTGAHPTIPLDVTEATWLVELPDRVLTDDELIGYRARALAKHKIHIDEMCARVSEDKIKRLLKHEKEHKAVIKDYKFKLGDLILVRNTAIEKSLDKKMKARYLGPMVVIRRTKGGSYVVAELNGALWQQKVGAFRCVPYFARKSIELPDNVLEWLEISEEGLQKILSSEDVDQEWTGGNDLTFGDMNLKGFEDQSDLNEAVI